LTPPADKRCLKPPAPPIPVGCAEMVRYGGLDLPKPEVVMLVEIPGNAPEREPETIIAPQGIALMMSRFRFRPAGNGGIGQRFVFAGGGVIDVYGEAATVLPCQKGVRRSTDDLPRSIQMHDLAPDADPGVFRQSSGQIAVDHGSL